MPDLKPGYVRVFQCSACGEIFYESWNAVQGHYHTRHVDGHDEDCGPITERILADPDVVREECVQEVIELPDCSTMAEVIESLRALSEREEL